MALTTAIVVGTTAASAAYSARQARNASRGQTQGSREAIAAQQDSESRALEMQRPFYEAGYAATAAMMDMAGLDRSNMGAAAANNTATTSDPADISSYGRYNWQADPGYEFRLGEGQRAIERSAAARGILNSGGTLRGIERYAQDYASNEYQRVFDRVAAIAGRGQSAANTGSNVIVNTGESVGRALVNAGDARASGYVAQGNAWSNAVSQVGMAAGAGMFGRIGSTGVQPMAMNYQPVYGGYA